MERAIESIGKSHNKVLDLNHHVDRLSDLPDDVICHYILRFLPTKLSVQTSILSKRWRTLWAHVPVLDLNYWDFNSSQTVSFPSIVCTIMSRHKVQSLSNFRLTYNCGDRRNYELETCIATAVERNVQIIYLQGHKVEVPRCLLTCKTLVDLTLSYGARIPPSAPFSLPNLKTLYLYYLDYEVDFTRLLSGCPVLEKFSVSGSVAVELPQCLLTSKTLVDLTLCDGARIPPSAPFSLPSLKTLYLYYQGYEVDFTRLLSGCPVLEKFCVSGSVAVELPQCLLTSKTLVDLTIGRVVKIPPTASISLPNLKKLNLWNLKCKVDLTRLLSGCHVLEELSIGQITNRDPSDCYIYSPTLKRLTIDFLFNNPDYMVTLNTPALRYLKVHYLSSKNISISPCTSLVEANIFIHFVREPADDFYHRCVKKLLNVKCLKLTGSCCDKICGGLMLGSIGNLTKLKLSAPWCFLTKFLESAHHLQFLTIVEYENSKHWMDPTEEPSECLLHSLKTVRIDGFRCKEQSFNMVRYILRNAQVLERMEIKFLHNVHSKKRCDSFQKITLFPRESKKCELAISSE